MLMPDVTGKEMELLKKAIHSENVVIIVLSSRGRAPCQRPVIVRKSSCGGASTQPSHVVDRFLW